MKPEVLESLLIDRELGELSPEVAELLAAYLAQNPIAAAPVAELARTLGEARHAVALTSRPALPPLETGRFGSSVQSRPSLSWWREGMRLAACLVAGALLGWSVHSSTFSRAAGLEAKVASTSQRMALRTDPPEPASAGFWSIDALAAARARNQPVARYRLHWTSPLTKPVIESIP